jgi:hypothetical protein
MHVALSLTLALVLSLHFTAPHKTHSVLTLLAYLPAPQAVQLAPAVVLTWPAAQSLQSRSPTVSPVICFPAAHSVQTVCPVSLFVYLFAGHGSQLVCSGFVLISSRPQASQLSWPCCSS